MFDISSSRRVAFMHKIKKTPNLYGYYPLNEVGGTTARNYAPATRGSLDGTISGANVGQPGGKIGRAYSHDGVNDNISLGDVPAISDATILSAFAIIKTNNVTADHQIFANNNGATAGLYFWADDVASVSGRTDTFAILINDGAQNARIESVTGANTGQLTMVGFSFTANVANGLHLYINGVEDANSPVTTANVDHVGQSNSNVTFGEDVVGAKDLSGFLQHVGFVVDRALSSAEHLKLARLAGF